MYPIGTREGMSLPGAESIQDMGEHFSLKKSHTCFNNFKASEVLLPCFFRRTLLAAHDAQRLLPSESPAPVIPG